MTSAPTDWDEIYLRIKFSPIGSDFSVEKFLATPVRKIFRIIKHITKHEETFFNYASVSAAHLNNQLMWAFHGFGGGGPPPRATVEDFLPFPDAARGKSGRSHEPRDITPETRTTLRRVLGEGRLSYDIFVELFRGPR